MIEWLVVFSSGYLVSVSFIGTGIVRHLTPALRPIIPSIGKVIPLVSCPLSNLSPRTNRTNRHQVFPSQADLTATSADGHNTRSSYSASGKQVHGGSWSYVMALNPSLVDLRGVRISGMRMSRWTCEEEQEYEGQENMIDNKKSEHQPTAGGKSDFL
ncbi:hypothetical protein GWK47_034972 [Chionoecetes opilio]|uniref:Uncharacterized protein n=1 Tax=Chionoecetes opilio TaxID=41210 RepID=A0A8J4YFY3_CHIOP|nr:hypothetical protein GWK47_034972 [Chionoecetes opilio]